MLDMSGRYRLRYDDTLRALGSYLDAQLFRDVTIVEVPDGFLVTGQMLQVTERSSQITCQTVLFTNDDLETLLDAAHARRPTHHDGREISTPGRSRAGSERIRYEDLLRAIGSYFGSHTWHDVVIMETRQGIQSLPPRVRLVLPSRV